MKLTLLSGAALFMAGIVLALIQLWLTPWSAEVFLKLEITIGALFAIAVAIWFVRKEYGDYQRQGRARLEE